ncbi:MAG: HEAT repeat domain-containing protein [Kofleriaceae bacterium]
MKTRTVLLASCVAALVGGGYWLGRASTTPAPSPAPSASSVAPRAAAIRGASAPVALAAAPVLVPPSSSPELVADLRDADPKVRRAAIREVARDRDADVALLLDASRDRDLEVSAAATTALGKAYRAGRIPVGELVVRAQDPSIHVKVRSEALNGLGAVPSPEAAALLAGLAASGSVDDRASAAILLRNQDLAVAVPALIAALGDAEARVREVARDSLVARSRGRDFGEDRAAWQAWWQSRR